MTAHWIDPEKMTRKSAALACRRIIGSHTFDKLAEVMHDVFTDYGIEGKISSTVTDNGDNFCKAFRYVFSLSLISFMPVSE